MADDNTRSSWLATLRQYQRFLPYTRPDRSYFLLDAASIVVAVVTNTAMIYLMGKPLSLIQQGQYDALAQVLGIFAVVLLVNQLSQFVGGWLTNRLVVSFIGRTRNTIMTKVLSLSFPILGKFPRGDLLARFSNDVDRVSNIVVHARLMLVSHILTLSLYSFMLFWINVQLALIALASLPLFILHQRFFSGRKRKAAERYLRNNGELVAFEEQSLANLRGISGNTAEDEMASRHASVFKNAGHWLMREWDLNVGFGVSFTLLIYMVGLLVVMFGVQEIHKGEIPVGLLVSFLLYLGYLTVPVRGMSEIIFQFLGNVPAARRVLMVMDTSGVVSPNEGTPDLTVNKGEIIFEQVRFTYPDGKPVLVDADAVINGGETIALVGPSGSGKSTFATLLLRFYDPQQGRILVDGQNLREVKLSSLRHNMAVVWQEGFVVNDTVRANLLMANPEASEQQIIEACQAGHAWEFIASLPKGLDTRLGAGGMDLSGGQKQRLAIAQAFLRDTPILILDEASSALDSHSEQVIVQALERLRKDRTTLMIAHRYSSIRSADRVIYFEGDGSLTIGLHQELFESHPDYRAAVEWQTGQSEKEHTQ
jgi:ABC-type multidrug transport system fused ATPase/permease subunit